jgi:hypothetical protein
VLADKWDAFASNFSELAENLSNSSGNFSEFAENVSEFADKLCSHPDNFSEFAENATSLSAIEGAFVGDFSEFAEKRSVRAGNFSEFAGPAFAGGRILNAKTARSQYPAGSCRASAWLSSSRRTTQALRLSHEHQPTSASTSCRSTPTSARST